MNGWIIFDDVTAICQGTPPPTATPTPRCKDSIGTYKTINLLSVGTLSSGSYYANQAVIGGLNYYVFDFTMTAPATNLMAGYNQAAFNFGINDPGGHRDNTGQASYHLTVNGQDFISADGSTFDVGVGSASTLTLHYHAEIPGSPSTVDTMNIATAAARLPTYQDPGQNLLCDAGMEQYPISDYWKAAGAGENGRLNSFYQSGLSNSVNGTAFCGQGMQAIGSFFVDSGSLYYNGAPITQPFHWDGGVAQWKFRAAAGHSGGSAHVYIVDNAGTNVADLFGSATNYFTGLLPGFIIAPSWQLKTGSVDLDEGDYHIVLAMGPGITGQTVYYDDVAIGTAVDQACQEDFQVLPTLPTPTQTPTGQLTKTPTPTYQVTVYKTPTLPASSTPGPTSTGTTTPTVTTTARPTRTATYWPTNTAIPSFTPRPTNTPYGTPGGPGGPYTSTPNPNHTATPEGTPPPTQASWNGGDMPPGNGNGTGTGMNGGTGDCTRPTNPWSISWWIDYEFCRAAYAVSWQPGHSATMVAIPSMFNNVEPFHTANEIGTGMNTVKTQVSSYVNSNDAFVDSGGPATNDPNIFKAAPNSPWNGAPLTLGPLPRGGAPRTFSTYCTARMISIIGTVIAPGYCFILNLLRDLGLLIWFQWLLDLLAALSLVRMVFVTIQFYPLLYDRGGKEPE